MDDIRFLRLEESQFFRIARRMSYEYRGEIVPAVGMPRVLIEKFDKLEKAYPENWRPDCCRDSEGVHALICKRFVKEMNARCSDCPFKEDSNE